MTNKDHQNYCMRPMVLKDLDTVSLWFENLADLSIFDRSSPVPVNKLVVERSWKEVICANEPRHGFWFTIDDAAGKIVGIAGLENINYINGDGIIAVYIAAQARHKGLAVISCGILLDLAFDQLRLNRITTYYRSDNVATQKLITKLGFSQEGVLRQGWFSGGRYFDIVVVGILGEEWPETRKKIALKLSDKTKLQFGRPQ
jgi:RimJ/RimL family protein N-acetyltransferase